MKPGTSAVVYNMLEYGHLKRLLPVISGLTRAGVRTHVFTLPAYCAEVENAGGLFIDLFRGRPLDEADALSIPIASRNVSFAGHFAEEVVIEAAALKQRWWAC